MLRIGVLVSGGGTNLQAIIDAISNGKITNAEIVTVVGSRPGIYALERAKLNNIPSIVISRKAFNNKIINIHPSLIPSFCGPGFYGLKVHEAALERGVKITGATVHIVNEVCDGGPILLQKAVEVKPGDTPEVLQKRVMEEAEWEILPKAIDLIANGKI